MSRRLSPGASLCPDREARAEQKRRNRDTKHRQWRDSDSPEAGGHDEDEHADRLRDHTDRIYLCVSLARTALVLEKDL